MITARADVGERLGVVQLVVARCVGVRHHHAGHTDVGDLGHGASTAAAHHHVAGGVGVVHAIDVRHGAGRLVAGQPGRRLLQQCRPGLDLAATTSSRSFHWSARSRAAAVRLVAPRLPPLTTTSFCPSVRPYAARAGPRIVARSIFPTSGISGIPTVRTSARLGRC